MTMNPFKINPLADPRWTSLLTRHPRASVFHTAGWLGALQRTYGYRPVAYTTSRPDEDLSNGLLVCEVESFFTGNRLVSLPFSDHCEPLVDSEAELTALLNGVRAEIKQEHWRFAEIRPLLPFADNMKLNLSPVTSFAMHEIDIRPDADQLFRGMHKSCVQAKIRRAEKQGLRCEQGRTRPLIESFYRLLLLTRRRQGIPPQPLGWFFNLVSSMGEDLTIHVASKDGKPVASILTLGFRTTLVYKYGCSDLSQSNLGATPLLFWHSIQDAKLRGAKTYDLGRSDLDNPGLIQFKERLGGKRTELNYYRFPHTDTNRVGSLARKAVQGLVARMPDPVFTSVGRLLYRHIG